MKRAKKYVMTPYEELSPRQNKANTISNNNDDNNKIDEDGSDMPGLDDIQFGGNAFLDALGSTGHSDPLAPLEVPGAPGFFQGAADPQGTLGAKGTVGTVGKKKNAIRARALDKATKSAKIISRLARVNGYNDEFEIKLRTGKYLNGSNLIVLLWHVLTPAREVQGLKEFTELLSDAGVLSDWIDNPNVRSTLAAMNGSSSTRQVQTRETPASPSTTVIPAREAPGDRHRLVRKRRGDDDDESAPMTQDAPIAKRRRLEDQLNRIRATQDSHKPAVDPTALELSPYGAGDGSVSHAEERLAKRRHVSDDDDDDDERIEDSDREDDLETQALVPTIKVPPLRSEILRARKQKQARKLRRPGNSNYWSDSDGE